MSKLVQGDKLPQITFNLIDGGSLTLPDEMPTRYVALLFYRGSWSPYCRRQLASYEVNKDELTKLEVTVITATSDDRDTTVEMAVECGLTMPTAYGVTEDQIAGFDAGYGNNEHGHFIQPMEFLISRGGTVFASMYASGPIDRMAVKESINGVNHRINRRMMLSKQNK